MTGGTFEQELENIRMMESEFKDMEYHQPEPRIIVTDFASPKLSQGTIEDLDEHYSS